MQWQVTEQSFAEISMGTASLSSSSSENCPCHYEDDDTKPCMTFTSTSTSTSTSTITSYNTNQTSISINNNSSHANGHINTDFESDMINTNISMGNDVNHANVRINISPNNEMDVEDELFSKIYGRMLLLLNLMSFELTILFLANVLELTSIEFVWMCSWYVCTSVLSCSWLIRTHDKSLCIVLHAILHCCVFFSSFAVTMYLIDGAIPKSHVVSLHACVMFAVEIVFFFSTILHVMYTRSNANLLNRSLT